MPKKTSIAVADHTAPTLFYLACATAILPIALVVTWWNGAF